MAVTVTVNSKTDKNTLLQEAYAEARRIKGENASLTCIPNGISVIVR